MTCLVAIDDMTEENGCLEFGLQPGCLKRRLTAPLPTTPACGNIQNEAADELQWTPAILKRGDVLVFDSHAPHRAGPNMSPTSRRALFLTFSRASKGNLRDAYYAHKRARMAAGEAMCGGVGDEAPCKECHGGVHEAGMEGIDLNAHLKGFSSRGGADAAFPPSGEC